jgi:SAM-dependent methyltransferase
MTAKARVVLAAQNSLMRDTRTHTEAQILTKAGLDVVVLGVLGPNQEAIEWRDGYSIKRVKNSLELAVGFKENSYVRLRKTGLRFLAKPILAVFRFVDRRSRRLVILIRLFRAMLAEQTDYYHAHFPLVLMSLAFLAAKLKNRRFLKDYNDVIVLENQSERKEGYYEQDDLWGVELDLRNTSRIEPTIELIPKGEFRLLDVGCGDGRLTNQLQDTYRQVVGFDVSRAALQHVEVNRLIASGTNIPFTDKYFDIVLSTEMLEHLPESVYRRALYEIKRVAGKWIVIGVPWKEQLSIANSRCIRCGTRFHVNYHFRNYDEHKIANLFSPEFALVKSKQVGVERNYYVPWLLWMNRHFGGIWTRTPATICPTCGANLYPGGYPERNAIRKFCDDRNKRVKQSKRLEMSHIIALYEKR